MATETLHFDNARTVQQLFNNDPQNLAAVESTLGVKVIARDGFIKLDGEPGDVAKVRQMFLTLESSMKGGATIRNREFASALSITANEGVEALQGLYQERVGVSNRKSPVSPKTLGQKQYIECIRTHDVTFGVGPAGTGKTYLAMAMAVSALKEEKVSRMILTRPAVEAGEALGFLPGDLYEKIDPYLRPLLDALHDMLPAEDILKYRERGIIEIAPLAYMRGRTLNQAFIVLDEAQNATAEQMFMFLTRLGYGSKSVITGDPTQTDLPRNKKSGLLEALQALRTTEGIGIMELGRRDVVRHPLVQRIVASYETHRSQVE
ncbi:MAG: PhoH family protein [Verrucomicrobia bacterium]|nr:PhoH family protein [Verrucomicrobiota bacterium]